MEDALINPRTSKHRVRSLECLGRVVVSRGLGLIAGLLGLRGRIGVFTLGFGLGCLGCALLPNVGMDGNTSESRRK